MPKYLNEVVSPKILRTVSDQCFKLFDKNKNGYIEPAELEHCLIKLVDKVLGPGHTVPNGTMANAMRVADKNADKRLDKDEFYTLIEWVARNVPIGHGPEHAAAAKQQAAAGHAGAAAHAATVPGK